VWVFGAQDAFAGFEGAAVEGLGGFVVASVREEAREVVDAGEGFWMFGAEAALEGHEGCACRLDSSRIVGRLAQGSCEF